jgi:DNA-binding NarL/FixJ family response regulator
VLHHLHHNPGHSGVTARDISPSSSSDRPTRVLLVDDSPELLTIAGAALAPVCVIVGTATDGRSALAAAGTLRPDVIVLDISMPGMSGLEVAAALCAQKSTAAIVFLTIHDDAQIVEAAMQSGGTGYVLKRRLSSDLLAAVQDARAGRSFISPRS